MLENALLVLLMQYLENYWTEFHQTLSVDAFWDKNKRFSVCGQKVKGQGHRMTKGPTGGGIQGSMLCIEL